MSAQCLWGLGSEEQETERSNIVVMCRNRHKVNAVDSLTFGGGGGVQPAAGSRQPQRRSVAPSSHVWKNQQSSTNLIKFIFIYYSLCTDIAPWRLTGLSTAALKEPR